MHACMDTSVIVNRRDLGHLDLIEVSPTNHIIIDILIFRHAHAFRKCHRSFKLNKVLR